jgi:hypothetical protein
MAEIWWRSTFPPSNDVFGTDVQLPFIGFWAGSGASIMRNALLYSLADAVTVV